MKFFFIVLSLTFFGFISGHVVAGGDVDAGKSKSRNCAVCHGSKGISRYDMRPNLAGQKAAYMIKQMHDFRDGKREDPFMTAQAKLLTDEDIEDISAYYASLK